MLGLFLLPKKKMSSVWMDNVLSIVSHLMKQMKPINRIQFVIIILSSFLFPSLSAHHEHKADIGNPFFFRAQVSTTSNDIAKNKNTIEKRVASESTDTIKRKENVGLQSTSPIRKSSNLASENNLKTDSSPEVAQSGNPAASSDDSLASNENAPLPNDSGFYQSPFENREQPVGLDFTSLIIRLLVAFGILAGGGYLLVKFFQKRRGANLVDNPLVNVIVNFPLQLQSRLMLIRVVNSYHIVLASNENMLHLEKIEDKASIDEIKIFENQKGASSPQFFKELLAGYRGGMAKSSPVLSSLAFTNVMSQKMKSNKKSFFK